MRNRNKYDWSKPFKFVDNRKAFEELDTNDENLVIVIPIEETTKAPPPKEDIPVPKIETVPRASVVKTFAKLTPNYIRLPAHLNLPLASNYELTEVDHTFLRSHHDKFLHRGRRVLTPEFLQKAFVELELKAGKDMTIPRGKGWMTSFIEREYKDLLEMGNAEQFAEVVYNFWKNRREQLRFPLLRALWRANPDEYNHMLAFRPRERDKRSLRRTNRVMEDEIVEELFEEFDLTLRMADRVQMREELKYRQAQLSISSFYAETKGFVTLPQWVEEGRLQDRQKDKQRMKAMHGNMQSFKNRKESLENNSAYEATNVEVDQKTSIANFLSTVVYEAELLGLSYERMFYSSSTAQFERQKSVLPPTQPGTEPEPQKVEEIKNPQEYFGLSLWRSDNLLLRSFQEEATPLYHVKPCKDYLELKRRQVDKYYFGSDDEGQVKDLRKNISASFKKFQQLQLARTVSAGSDNL